MSVANPGHRILRQSVVGMEGMFVKMWDPPTENPATPDLVAPTNPVPEVMAAAGYQNVPSAPHTVVRDGLHGRQVPTWDGRKQLMFYEWRDKDNITAAGGTWPGATIRVPRGVIFHGDLQGHGPPPHTIHWHGIEPSPMNDGVGHCSMELGHYVYQWQPNFIGTYFYHCHRNTVQHFEFGLYGMLLIEPPDAYFATLANPVIPIGHCRDGKKRTAANLGEIRDPNNNIVVNPFPGFNSNLLTAPDPWTGDPALKFATDPHAMTVPYDVEVLWVPDDRDSNWSDLAPDSRATYPKRGNVPGVDDNFHGNAGGGVGPNQFFAFNDFNPDYWFVSGVPVPAPRGGTGAIPAGIVVPPELNSGKAGMQVSIEAQVGQTIYIRCLDAAYNCLQVTLPVDGVIIAWDGRALGVPPYGYNYPYLVPANTPIHMSVARRFDMLIKATGPISSFAEVKFIDTRGQLPGEPEVVLCTAQIPINIVAAPAGVYAVSGTLTDENAAPLAGVTIDLTGPGNPQTTVTDRSGNYSLAGLPDGSYTVTPVLAGAAFTPASRNVTVNGANVTGQNFLRVAATGAYSITGSVFDPRGTGPAPTGDLTRQKGKFKPATAGGIPGVQINLAGPVDTTVVSDMFGNYSFTGLPNGRYTIMASHADYRFAPREKGVTVNGANRIGLVFRGRKLR